MKTSPRSLPHSRRLPASRVLRGTLAAAACALAATLAHSAPASTQEHVGINAERGDPARWYVPADTPRLKYEAEVKGVRAALAEALKECRAMPADRACVTQANAQYRLDMENARSLLSQGGPTRTTPGAKP